MTGGHVRQYPYFVRLFHTSTPLRGVELRTKKESRVHDWGKVRQYPYFVRLLQTSTPLRSVELNKKWRNSGFRGQGWTWLGNYRDARRLRLHFCQNATSGGRSKPRGNAQVSCEVARRSRSLLACRPRVTSHKWRVCFNLRHRQKTHGRYYKNSLYESPFTIYVQQSCICVQD